MRGIMANNNSSSRCLRIIYRNFLGLVKRVQIGPNEYTAEGKIVDIFNIFASYYNICYTLTFHDRKTVPFHGNYDPVNKTFIGSLGYVQRNTHDMVFLVFFGNQHRYRYFDFSSYMFMSTWGAIFAYPTVKPNYAGFFQIFDYISWTALACTFVLGLVMIVLLEMISNIIQPTSGKKIGFSDIGKTIRYEFIILLGAILGQSVEMKKSKYFSRNLFIFFWLFSNLLLNFFYKSKLLSVMAVPKISIPFSDVYEMVEQDEVKWHLLAGTIVHTGTQGAPKNSTLGKIYAKSIGILDDVVTPRNLEKVRQGKLTIFYPEFIIPQALNDLTGQNKDCQYTKMKEPFIGGATFFLTRKGMNATIQSLLKKTITRLTEGGIVDHVYYKDIKPSVFYCISSAGKRGNSLRTLQVEDFLGVFGLLFVGFTMATIAFVLEFIIWRRTHLKHSSTRRNI